MKANSSASNASISLSFIVFFLVACQKEKVQPVTVEPGATVTSQRPQVIAKTNDLVLKSFTRNGRTYHFYYAPNGKVDSIVVTGDEQCAYRAFYKGNHLDSVILIHDGLIESVHRNFQYKGDLIASYDYFLRKDNNPYPWYYSFAYDAQNRIVSVKAMWQSILALQVLCSYDNNGDMIHSNDGIDKDVSYTYDSHLNPLHLVPNLFALFVEEPYIWEYCFSLHNSISKAIPACPTIMYTNQYNEAGQLTRKTWVDHWTTTFSFTYE